MTDKVRYSLRRTFCIKRGGVAIHEDDCFITETVYEDNPVKPNAWAPLHEPVPAT